MGEDAHAWLRSWKIIYHDIGLDKSKTAGWVHVLM